MRFKQVINDALTNNDAKRLRYFLALEWPSGWVRVHSGLGERRYNGETYYGLGELGKIGALKEDDKVNAKRLNLQLSITDKALVREVLADDPIGGSANLHLIVLDENQRIFDGDLIFSGSIGDMSIVDGAITSVSVSLVDWLEVWNRPIENNLYSNAAQQADHPGDKFFDQLELLASKPLSSGIAGAPVAGSGSTGGGGSGGGGRDAPYKRR